MENLKFVPRLTPVGYNRHRERWLPQKQRTKLTDEKKSKPVTEYLYRAYVHEVKKLARTSQIDLSFFPFHWEVEIKFKNFRMNDLALDEISFLPYEKQAEIIVDIIAYMHDGWVKDHAADFFGYYMGYEFLYLPIELAGEETFGHYYDTLSTRLAKLGFSCMDYDAIKGVYHRRQREFLLRYHVSGVNDLVNLVVLASRDYKAINKSISKSLECRTKAFEVANQLMYYAPELLDSFQTKKVAR